MVEWDSNTPLPEAVTINHIDSFNARGMRRVYGRGDRFDKKCSFNMDVWLARDGRLLARFWARSDDVDGRSIEVHGIPVDAIPRRRPDSAFTDAWIPEILRQEYADWIEEEW